MIATMTATTAPHPAVTNQRRARCIECHRHIAPSAGRQVARGQYICETCAGLRDSNDRYTRQITSRLPGLERLGIWMTFERIIREAKSNAPLVLQAVDDRTAWMEPGTVTRDAVVTIANEELVALGYLPVW